jgi:membrane-bound metal-dependent hydrolase YbcI (DUF457 family)
MTARTHDVAALASLITVATYFPPANLTVTTLIIAIIANNIGALIPDIDSASNRLWDLLPAGDLLGRIFSKIFYKHRTITHSLLGAGLIYFFLTWLLPKFIHPQFVDIDIIVAATMIGYLSHLLADSLTKDGLPLFFPINLDIGLPPIKALRIKTGGWIEKSVIYPGTIAFLIWFAFSHQSQLTLLLHSINK